MRVPFFVFLALALSSVSAHAQTHFGRQATAGEPFPVEITPVDAAGRGLDVWSRSGDEFLVATPGEFGLRLYNKTNKAVRVVLGMDGENLLDGAPWQIHGNGFIIPANTILLVKCDARGIPLRFSSGRTHAGQGEIRWAIFEERMWWADPRRNAPLPPVRAVPPSKAGQPSWEVAFHSRTPYQDQLGTLYYDRPRDLELRGVIPNPDRVEWRMPVAVIVSP